MNTTKKQSSNNTKAVTVVALIIIVVLSILLVRLVNKSKTVTDTGCETTELKSVTITYDGVDFSPSCITINTGTKINWVNNSSKDLEVGSGPHPVHTGDKAISNGSFVYEIKANSQNTEEINKPGTYDYHDHLNSSATGIVKVK